MRKLNLIVLALVSISLLAAPLALSQGGKGMKGGNVEQQIAALSDQHRQAYLKGDTSFFEKYLADDYTAIYASGRLWTKTQEIEDLKAGTRKFEAIDVQERKISNYGNTSVVTQLFSMKGAISGKPFSGDFRCTRVWVKQKGNWKLVAFQVTRVAPPSQ